jgi:hypothetical protein
MILSTSVVDHCKAIKALIPKLAHAERKVDEYHRTIGKHIAAIKKEHPNDWLKVVKVECDLGRRSAYNYLAIIEGTATVEEQRANNRERVARHRALRNAQNPSTIEPLAAAAANATADTASEAIAPVTNNLPEAAVLDIAPFDLLVADLKRAGLAERVHDVVRDDLKILYLCLAFVRAGWPRQVLTDFVGQGDKIGEPVSTTADPAATATAPVTDNPPEAAVFTDAPKEDALITKSSEMPSEAGFTDDPKKDGIPAFLQVQNRPSVIGKADMPPTGKAALTAANGAIHKADSAPKKTNTNGTAITLGKAVATAFGALAELADECQEAVENSPVQSQRIETLSESAGRLEDLRAPAVTPELADIKIDLPKRRKPRSRGDRRDAATSALELCVEALNAIAETDPRHQAVSLLRDELVDASKQADDCDFPGIYG